jgi:hypothetical protein
MIDAGRQSRDSRVSPNKKFHMQGCAEQQAALLLKFNLNGLSEKQ